MPISQMMKLRLEEDNSLKVPKVVRLTFEEAEFEISVFKAIIKSFAMLSICLPVKFLVIL